ncbi:4-hydroxy-3-methylbut-2-enyl diphosphate reductase [Roseivirga sp. BDSF3-8]|uniref:4-hydroxy-3-methylbut-2-enyl diphosphate reductase n=1 Tax=Roseivirga sp. BDSF3-8 TaxID=3241598 RepID=UPI003531A57A
MKNLRVEIDANSGFCFGVVYAIEMAEDILEEEGRLYCLGDIVHNDAEVERLQRKGLVIIDHEELLSLRNEKVLIRAHGEPPSTYKLASENNLTLIDASCPVVLKLQNRIRNSYSRGEKIYIYGKHGHAEVKGLLGQTKGKATVFQDVTELKGKDIPQKVTLYSQTTKSTDSFYSMAEKLKSAGTEVNVNDTICRQVSNRDKELRDFADRFDKVVFVSGTKSSNGKVLYQVCKDRNDNTFFVSSSGELDPEWFQTNESVGVCGATSTPMWLMQEVRDRLHTL